MLIYYDKSTLKVAPVPSGINVELMQAQTHHFVGGKFQFAIKTDTVAFIASWKVLSRFVT